MHHIRAEIPSRPPAAKARETDGALPLSRPARDQYTDAMTTANEMPSSITQLPADDCWKLFRSADFGRLGVIVESHPEIFPVNYVVDHGSLVFRSAPGTKLDAALANEVVMEVDGFNPDTSVAWSVVARGSAQRMTSIEDVLESALLPLFPWQSGEKNNFVRVVPSVVTGRRFVVPASARRGPGLSDSRRFRIE